MSSAVKALFKKEVQALAARREFIVSVFGFALLLVVVASMAFRQIGYGDGELLALTPGMVLLVFLFSGISVLHHGFQIEIEGAALNGVLLSPIDPAVVFFTKYCSQLLFLFILEMFVVAGHALFVGISLFQFGWAIPLVAFLFAVGFAAMGTILSAVSVVNREREILLPLLLFPLLIPLIVGTIEVLRAVTQTGALDLGSFWFVFVCSFDVIVLAMSAVLFEFVVKP